MGGKRDQEARLQWPAAPQGGTEWSTPSEATGLPLDTTGLAGSAARTRHIGRGTSNAAAHLRGDHIHARDRHRQAETRQGLGEGRLWRRE